MNKPQGLAGLIDRMCGAMEQDQSLEMITETARLIIQAYERGKLERTPWSMCPPVTCAVCDAIRKFDDEEGGA